MYICIIQKYNFFVLLPCRAQRPLVLWCFTKFAPFVFLYFAFAYSGGADLRVREREREY